MARLLRLAMRSLVGKAILLAAIFLGVPLILYQRFERADAARQAFLLRTLQVQGRLAAQSLSPLLANLSGRSVLDVAKAVEAMPTAPVGIKLLLRPNGGKGGFFLVATNPTMAAARLETERQGLVETGVLARLDESCEDGLPLALRHVRATGGEELLTALTATRTRAGCWVVISSLGGSDLADAALNRPFAETPEVRLATVFYLGMAVLLIMAVAGTTLDLGAFARLARRIRHGHRAADESFAGVAAIPELLPVAREFDRMVATLDASANALREAAEDTAHAFKGPIATIMQSMEPLRPLVAEQERGGAVLTVIEKALHRLDGLVSAARHLDESTAALINAPLQPVDLAALAAVMIHSHERFAGPRDVRMVVDCQGPAVVTATEDSLETVLENLLDNAVDFSPLDGSIRVAVRRIHAEVWLTVEDDGPGVPPERLEDIFRRNTSHRPPEHGGIDGARGHFGVGLAVVRRTAELLGGSASAATVPGAGLRVTVVLPAAA